MFELLATDPNSKARRSRLTTAHGVIETPAFMPVGTQGTVKAVSPRELNHFNQRRSVSITANLAPGYSLGEALRFIDDAARRVLPTGYATELNGVSREFRSSSGALGLVFVLALAFIFLVLSAQFESFGDPFVILLALPLSIVGAQPAEYRHPAKHLIQSFSLHFSLIVVDMTPVIPRRGGSRYAGDIWRAS